MPMGQRGCWCVLAVPCRCSCGGLATEASATAAWSVLLRPGENVSARQLGGTGAAHVVAPPTQHVLDGGGWPTL